MGSRRAPFSVRISTRGRETVISKPSRRIVSTSTPSCNSPRPPISNASLLALSSKVMATFVSASANRRSRMTVEVTFLPSLPANGLSLTVMVTDIVGGSTGEDASAVSTSGSQIVSATDALVSPAMQIRSPACTASTATRSVPSKRRSLVSRPVSTCSPARLIALTGALTFAVPWITRPVRQRPI